MLTFIIVLLAIMFVSFLIYKVGKLLNDNNPYWSVLETYINIRNPQSHAEIEKLQQEFELHTSRKKFL